MARPTQQTLKRRRSLGTLLLLGTVLLAAVALRRSPAAEEVVLAAVPGGAVRAPEFPDDADWLNTEQTIRLEDLRGKVVLLDFWTYCCINCMHILPELKKLEHKYADELVVLGVHSAKFETERDTDNIRQAILRYDIEHPVLNDADFRVWNEYAARAWPTLVLIDPRGYIVGQHSGEITFEEFDPVIGKVVRDAERAGTLDRGPVEFTLEREREPRTLLRFPGKVLADDASGRLIIADSAHHRYLVAGLDGTVRDVIGTGSPGFDDGGFADATFRNPQGMALAGDRLYLADTENHAVRVADLTERTVTTLAGSGRQGRHFNRSGAGADVDLRSPWDLLHHDGVLYVAMAGSHQIWTIDPASGEARPFAGSGREDIVDGPRFVAAPPPLGADFAKTAALAQPSGLTTDGHRLYFADSETSAVRSVAFGNGRVMTHLGHGLFEFGDVDGDRERARLQHPLGVAFADGAVYIADTYNDKIKRLDLGTGTVATYAGTGDSGARDGAAGQALFDEPGGLSHAGGKLYVADTNNHAIRVIDLNSGQVSTLTLGDMNRATPPDKESGLAYTEVALPPATVGRGAGRLKLQLLLPPNHKVHPEAPLTISVDSSDPEVVQLKGKSPFRLTGATFPLTVPVTFTPGQTELVVETDVYYCTERGAGACLFAALRFKVPLTVTEKAGGGEVVLMRELKG